MADHDLLHTAELVKAALPYIDSNLKVLAELFVKTFDLMGSLKTLKSNNGLAACGFEISKIDLEGLLTGIRPVCNKRELEFVDRILNIFHMKKMFEMYNNMMETMKTMQEFGGFSFGGSDTDNDTENVTGNFSGSNFESIFESFKNMMGSDGSFSNNSDSNVSEEFNPNQNTQSSPFENSNSNPFENFSQFEDSYPFDNSSPHPFEADHTTSQDTTDFEKSSKEEPPGGGKGRSNDMMFEMLKAMVPPEQKSTFENLSMLLNSMSYDNNSKNDSKE